MADHTAIEWTDATWNPITGCSVVSPGCTNCYAMRLAGTRLQHHPSRIGLTNATKVGPVWTGEVRLNKQWLDEPLHWRRPRKIFVCPHGDLFHAAVPDEVIEGIFAIMAGASRHTFQVLTKRSDRMRRFMNKTTLERCQAEACARDWWPSPKLWDRAFINGPWPLPNVQLGVSVEDQSRADTRISDLLATPAAFRFVSAEPMLGYVDLCNIQNLAHPIGFSGEAMYDALRGGGFHRTRMTDSRRDQWEWRGRRLDWVIAGGESGPNARPMHPGWIHKLRDQCSRTGVPFFFKQWGEFRPADGKCLPLPSCWIFSDGQTRPDLAGEDMMRGPTASQWIKMERVGKKAAGAVLDGREWRQFPK